MVSKFIFFPLSDKCLDLVEKITNIPERENTKNHVKDKFFIPIQQLNPKGAQITLPAVVLCFARFLVQASPIEPMPALS